MQHLKVSGAVWLLKWSLGVKWLIKTPQLSVSQNFWSRTPFWCQRITTDPHVLLTYMHNVLLAYI